MAKLVIAGSADCPHFARVELLADDLMKNLPNFKLHKIVRPANEWPEWSRHCCRERGWRQQQSPIIWRELVNQGGKGVLVGGPNEFQELAKAYYDFDSNMVSPGMLAVAKDNARYKIELDAEEAHLRSLSKPLRVLVTAAAGPMVYQLLPLLMDGTVFGAGTELAFTLFDCGVTDASELEGLSMEAFDSAHPLVRSLHAAVDFPAALTSGVDVLLLLDELLMTPAEAAADPETGSDPAGDAARTEWLGRNAAHYKRYAEWLTQADCTPRLKVLLAGRGPVNFAARVLLEACPRLAAGNVAASSRLFERQAKGALAGHLKVPPSSVTNLIVWGDPAGQHLVDLGRTRVHHYDGAVTGPDTYSQAAQETVWDRKWLGQEFPKLVRQRQRANLHASSLRGSAVSSAQATADTVRNWWLGRGDNETFSFGVASAGWYRIPRGMVFSFPVRYHPKGAWSVVEDADLSEEAGKRLRDIAEASKRDYQLVFPPVASDAKDKDGDGGESLGGEIEIAAVGHPSAEELAASSGAAASAAAAEHWPTPGADMASVEQLRDRIAALKLPALSADALLKLTPALADELLAVSSDPTLLRERLRVLEDAPLTTVQEADEATASAVQVPAGASGGGLTSSDNEEEDDE